MDRKDRERVVIPFIYSHQGSASVLTGIRERRYVPDKLRAGAVALVNLSFQPKRERKLASRGGGWALRAQAD